MEPSSRGCPARTTFFIADLPPYVLIKHRYRLEGTLEDWNIVQKVKGGGWDNLGTTDVNPDLYSAEELKPISAEWRDLPPGACAFSLRVENGELLRGKSSTYGCFEGGIDLIGRATSPWPPPSLAGLGEGLHWFLVSEEGLASFPAP
jgi:hypothetical protein